MSGRGALNFLGRGCARSEEGMKAGTRQELTLTHLQEDDLRPYAKDAAMVAIASVHLYVKLSSKERHL